MLTPRAGFQYNSCPPPEAPGEPREPARQMCLGKRAENVSTDYGAVTEGPQFSPQVAELTLVI